MPRAFVDPYGNRTIVDYDSYSLQPTCIVDPVGNITTVEVDYRALAPTTIIDPNGNSAAVVFDALGTVAGTASMGKQGQNVGDSLVGFKADLTQTEIDAFFAAPRGATAIELLGNASSRIVYDPTRYWRDATGSYLPSYAATITRETHASDPVPAAGLMIQVSLAYSDGFGRIVQAKIQAKAGAVVDGGPIVQQRWIGSGWTIYNNKGDPVRKYEPFFDDTPDFKYNMRVGFSRIIMYDPLSRPIVTVYPDHSFQKSVFGPWHKVDFDGCDNVSTSNPKNDADIGYLFDTLPDHEYLPSWYDARIGGHFGPEQKANTIKSTAYDNTPRTAHFDALGRTILSIEDNGNGNMFSTHLTVDILGQKRAVLDALNRVVDTYDYSLCGDGIHQASMEAGEWWTLTNATSQQLYQWNSRGFRFRSIYDAGRRPTEVWTQQAGVNEFLFQKIIWGEGATDADVHNLRGKVFTVQDQAGMVVSKDYDFKGNLLNSSRQYARNYKIDIDWSVSVDLENPEYPTSLSYDALNRPVISTAADKSITFQGYNEGRFLDKVFVNARGENSNADPLTWTAIVSDVDHNARNQISGINYGNGASRTFTYDPLRFRLTSLITSRPSGDNPLQDLTYVYDPAGNVTHIRDDAQQTIFFRNKRVDPTCDYTYDAVYRLISASGREHLGQVSGQPIEPAPPQPLGDVTVDQPSDGNAMRIYTELYAYDDVGNILSIAHARSDPKTPSWTRTYNYSETSLIEPSKKSNKLSSTAVGSTTDAYRYDRLSGSNGNITSMPHLTWVPETTYYRYDSTGNRIRKVTERQASAGTAPTRMKERLYLGGLEIYREYAANGSDVTLERTDLDVKAETKCIVLIQSRTQGTDSGPRYLLRYQLDNHLASATIELDEQALVISFEEYFPYGSSSYRAVQSQTEVPPKRYRFCGKESDAESEFYSHGARYCAPWLGRWTSCDAAGPVDGPNLYVYVNSNLLRYEDPEGKQAADKTTPTRAPDPAPPPGTAPAASANPAAPAAPATPVTPAAKPWYQRAGESGSDKAGEYWKDSKEFIFGVKHPIAAIAIKDPLGSGPEPPDVISPSASTIAVHFSIRIGLEENIDREGSQTNAVRHTLWQALITTWFNSDLAKDAADSHEVNAGAADGVPVGSRVYESSKDVDQVIDLRNNVIGRLVWQLHQATGGTDSPKDLAQAVPDQFHTGGLYVRKDVGGGRYTDQLYKLTDAEHAAASAELGKLSNLGLRPDEVAKRRAAIGFDLKVGSVKWE